MQRSWWQPALSSSAVCRTGIINNSRLTSASATQALLHWVSKIMQYKLQHRLTAFAQHAIDKHSMPVSMEFNHQP
jgi:hypothetical protein